MNMQTDLRRMSGTVVAIAPSPAANRSGKIKLQEGDILYAFPEKLAQIAQGSRYEFDVEPYVKEGKQYLNVKNLRSLEPIRDNPNITTGRPTAQAQPPARQQQAEQPRNGSHFNPPPPKREAPPQHGAAFPVEWQRPTHPRDSRRMFICAMMAQDIAAGRFGSDEEAYVERVAMWARVYDRTIGLDDPQ
jgi:hypothetical protein